MKRHFALGTATLLAAGALIACTDSTMNRATAPESDVTAMSMPLPADNPFSAPSTLQFQYPRFDLIEEAHYPPAFEAGMAAQLAEIEAIASQADAPTVENTLVALERSGQLLDRVASVFYGLVGAHTNDRLKELQAEIAPKLAAHRDRILLHPELFARIDALHAQRADLGLDAETLRLVEETHKDFVRAGARLSEAGKERMRAINAELAELRTRFEQNVLDEGNALAIVVDSREELAGLDDTQIQTAAKAAESRELGGKYVIPLLNTTQQPLMSELEDRALRERMLKASMSRGNRGGELDNREVVSRIARLRAEQSQLLGYATHADFVLDEETAGSVAAVNERLAALTPPAVANARHEAEDLQAVIAAEGGDFELAAWDW
ncbi:MAG TPA: M3 family metallopeptidase, partial [Gammaproteobacteria bacterium]|nr:M3 family metallopeptidase [Gammaproteobacteria bacterium]